MFSVTDTEFNFSDDFKAYHYLQNVFTPIVEYIHSRMKVRYSNNLVICSDSLLLLKTFVTFWLKNPIWWFLSNVSVS